LPNAAVVEDASLFGGKVEDLFQLKTRRAVSWQSTKLPVSLPLAAKTTGTRKTACASIKIREEFKCYENQ